MSSALLSGVSSLGSSVPGMWRSHSVLSESEAESSPEAVQHFRKLRSSSSLNSLRLSLRKRLPLKSVQPNNSISENPTSESLEINKKTSAITQMKRTAKNSIGHTYQKIQKSMTSREDYLVRTPGRIPEGDENHSAAVDKHTPKRKAGTPGRTPRSGAKHMPRVTGTPQNSDVAVRTVRTGGTRRQLVRMAALRSPFASPNTMSRRRQLDLELDSIATGLGKLKRLSQAFNDVIRKDERTEVMERCRSMKAQNSTRCSTSKLNSSTISQHSRRIRHRVGSWTDSAISTLRKST